MISFRDQDTRRGLRAIIEALVSLAFVAFVWYYSQKLTGGTLAGVLHMTLVIIGMGAFFYGAENVTRSVRFKAGTSGIEGSVGDDVADAADAVATAAVAKAEDIKSE